MLSKAPPIHLLSLIKNYSSPRNLNLSQRCYLSSQKIPDDVISCLARFPPLSQPIQNLPEAVYSTIKQQDQETQITVLSNGLKVASENHFGQFCTVGVLIDSGPRYEVAYPSGVSHFLEKLAFNSTKSYNNKDHIMHTIEKHGGICDCQASRDTFVYAASIERKGIDTVTQILGDITLRPRITEEELSIARQTVQFELEALESKPEQEPIIMDMIHAAAYRDNTLGLPKICPAENINKISRQILFTYLKHHFAPSRMVIAASGIEHKALVEAVEKYFIKEKPIWEDEKTLIIDDSNLKVDTSLAQYTGGYLLDECNVPVYAGPSGLPELSHIAIGLEGVSHQDKDFIPMCVLNMIMGGGGSFSAGGPGKGMYTRLYTNVLNRYHWLYSATAYNQAYVDSGLFCIHASSTPQYVKEMVEVVVHELVAMSGEISDSELARAKKQLQSMLLMNLEQRPVIFEDIARQVLATGTRKRPEYYIKAIDAVTKDDIKRISARLLKSPPSVAARGDIRNMPSLANIQAGLLDSQGRLPGARSRLSLFR
ncbi:mitochondrial-processing peptidase subunit alpha [Prorops nasuta]|uniref:mitochondrial-processing peptidase subunit alpha n=1 Tax=Prorops nasuta TaxID=863751 RepID=UPI0034CD23DE